MELVLAAYAFLIDDKRNATCSGQSHVILDYIQISADSWWYVNTSTRTT